MTATLDSEIETNAKTDVKTETSKKTWEYSCGDPDEVFDVTIIGGGPVGLFGAFYAGLRGMRAKIMDSLEELGGQLATLYPEKYVFDMPGFPKVLARDLANQLIEQAMRYNPAVCLGELVLELKHEADDTITLTTQKGTHRTKTIVIATGAGAFSPKKLVAPGLEEFEERGVHYFVKNKSGFADKRLLIVGGGDSALDWAMNLGEQAKEIILIHRRDVFKAHEESVDWLLNRSSVDTRLFHELASVEGDETLRKVTIFDNRSKEKFTLEIDAVLINLGFNTDLGPIKEWGVHLDGKDIAVNQYMQTNLPGVYAAGDITAYPGKLKLIATGVGEICTAVYHAKTVVDPGTKFKQIHSSNLDLK